LDSSIEIDVSFDTSQVERRRLYQVLHLRSSRRSCEMNQQDYVQAVLDTYVSLPSAPERPRRDDRYLATKLYRQGVPLLEFECALLLGCARRELQEHDEPVQPIRSLRYFVPVLEEVQQQSLDAGYVRYLRGKLSGLVRPKPTRTQQARGDRAVARQLRLRW